ncbi:MAG TPA: class I SAM-dependent methyltransferase, partial [Ferruginibacter sp.]|nr:class I SAM-dependent methyltransferase [Ferruginibacter sp.]
MAHTYKPLLERYLSRTRRYRYGAIVLDISPEVFHPGFFYSTELLLKYLGRLPLQEKKVLELGCGSGLISIAAAQKGAHVTASDINPVAIDFLHTNSAVNGVHLNILQSDLFAAIPEQRFDIIAINPPYYKKQAVTAKDHAWFCG